MKKFVKKFCGIFTLVYFTLFMVYYLDLDGKAIYYFVIPVLRHHYDNIQRPDVTKYEYIIDKFPKYDDVVE